MSLRPALRWTSVASVLMAMGVGCGSTDSDGLDDPGGSNGPTGDSTTGATSSSVATNTSASSGNATAGNDATITTNTAATGSTTGTGGTANGGTGMGVGGNGDDTASTVGTTSGTSGGAGGSGGGGGTNGACPAEPPAPDSVCSVAGQTCAYEDCGGEGRSIARCSNGAWAVQTGACGDVVGCGNSGVSACDVGSICLVVAGGAIFTECVPNTCETGPVSCDCIAGCTGMCDVLGDPSYGISINCNTCPGGACP